MKGNKPDIIRSLINVEYYAQVSNILNQEMGIEYKYKHIGSIADR